MQSQLNHREHYQEWRAHKLAAWSRLKTEPAIVIQNPSLLTVDEHLQLAKQVAKNNLAIYRFEQTENVDRTIIQSFCEQIGMHQLDQNLCADEDSISTLQVMPMGRKKGYIPYSDQRLNWHTDGYYNPPGHEIRSFLLHCVQAAAEGGSNRLLNHELLYISLYDEDPELCQALMATDSMTIPANIENDVELRPAQSGPVFFNNTHDGSLNMRYTARSRSIQWKACERLATAVKRINTLLEQSEAVLDYHLKPGEGIICNNILHARSAFTNGSIPQQQRLLYRVRSHNRLFLEE